MTEYRDAIMACPECKKHIKTHDVFLKDSESQVKHDQLPYVARASPIDGGFVSFWICPHCRVFLGATYNRP